MRDAGRIAGWTIALLVAAALDRPVSEAAVKPRAVAVLPFDTSTLERDQQWIGEGVAEVISAGSRPAPGVRARSTRRACARGQPSVWNEAAVAQAARTLRADAALFGQIVKRTAPIW